MHHALSITRRLVFSLLTGIIPARTTASAQPTRNKGAAGRLILGNADPAVDVGDKVDVVYVSDYPNFVAAATAAAGAIPTLIGSGSCLVVDADSRLTQNYTLPVAVRSLAFDGGILTFGSYDLTGQGQALSGPDSKIFDLTGTGRLKGFFTHDWFYAAWAGVVSVEAIDASPFTNSASYAAANKTYLQAVEDYAAQNGGYVVRVRFTRYMTAVNGGITNRVHGICTEWYGINQQTTRIYCPDGHNIRNLWGTSSASTKGITCYSDLGLFCSARSSGIAINVSNSCYWVLARRCYFSQMQKAILLTDQADGRMAGFAENCTVEDCSFDADCGIPIQHLHAAGGTGSRRGFSVRGRNIWSPTTSASGSSDTFCLISPGVIPYNWGEFNITCTTERVGRNIYIIDNQSANVCNIARADLDLESGDPTYNIVVAKFDSSLVTFGSGPPSIYGGSVQYGKSIFNGNIYAVNTRRYIQGGFYQLEQRRPKTLTGNLAAADLGLMIPGAGSYIADLLLRTSAGGTAANFTARARLVVLPDDGDGFAGAIYGYVHVLSNTSGIRNPGGTGPFDLTNFSLGSDGLLKLSANLGRLTVNVTGSVSLGGVS